MLKLNVIGTPESLLSADLAAHADIEVASEAAEGIVIDGSSTDVGAFDKALQTGTPVLLYRPNDALLSTLEKLTGHRPSTDHDLVGIRKLTSPEGQTSYEMLAGDGFPATIGLASDGESAPLMATEDATGSTAGRMLQTVERLRAGSVPTVLKAGPNNYAPPEGATYWSINTAWGPSTATIGNGDDVNVIKKLNASVQEQTPSLTATADLHIYYTDDPQPSYVIYARCRVNAAAGYRLADTGDARGYFLSKIFMDFQLETSEGTLIPLDHVPRTSDRDEPTGFPLTTAEMQLKVKTETGTGRVNFKPEDSVYWATKGWGIKDESAGNRVKICFYQKDGWNSLNEERTNFGSWWQGVFGGKYGGKVNGMPVASFGSITTEAVGGWRLTGKFNGKHEIYVTLRPGDMGFHQEMAFIHNIHSCNGGGNLDNRHHHLFMYDFWAGSPWYLKLSDLPKRTK